MLPGLRNSHLVVSQSLRNVSSGGLLTALGLLWKLQIILPHFGISRTNSGL